MVGNILVLFQSGEYSICGDGKLVPLEGSGGSESGCGSWQVVVDIVSRSWRDNPDGAGQVSITVLVDIVA